MRAQFELLCFDLDGTLVDSAPDLSFSLGEALLAVDFEPPTEAQTRDWIGDGVENLLRRALTNAGSSEEETFRHALSAFHRSYTQNLFVRSRLYSGVTAILESLGDAGARMCCVTNKRSDYAVALLERAGLAEYFEFTFGGDSFANKKPHPVQLHEAARRTDADAARCVLIGDSDTDSVAAKTAGFAFIWASFGYCSRLRSREISTVPTATRFTDIPAILSTLAS